MKLFSIDPAVKNIGVCFYDTEHPKKVRFCDKFSIYDGKFKSYQQNKTIDYLKPVFFNEDSPLRKYINASDIVLIEVQIKSKFNMIQIALGAYLDAIGKQYKFIAPVSMNTYFNIGKKFRPPISGPKKTVDRKHYELNKKDGIRLISNKLPEIVRNLKADKQDDICDAIKLCLYYDQAILNKPPPKPRKRKTILDKPPPKSRKRKAPTNTTTKKKKLKKSK